MTLAPLHPNAKCRTVIGEVYFIGHAGGHVIKIGWSKSAAERLKTLKGACPFPVSILAKAPGRQCDEWAIHNHFINCRAHCEWFYATKDLLAFVATVKQTGSIPEDFRGDNSTRRLLMCGPRGPYMMEAAE